MIKGAEEVSIGVDRGTNGGGLEEDAGEVPIDEGSEEDAGDNEENEEGQKKDVK